MSGPATNLVEAEDLRRTFDDTVAIDGVDLSVPSGSLTSVIGPSGSGKTTLIRLLLGILSPTSGSIRTWETASTELSRAQRRRIGYLPQNPALLPDLSIMENLRFYASMAGYKLTSADANGALEQVELAEHRKVRVLDASGGMQRRLGLACALIHQPDLIVLDEPTAGLDPVLRQSVWDRLRALQEAGRSLVVTTQYVGEAANCDRVLLVREGRVHFDGTPIELRRAAYGGDVIDLRTVDLLRQDDIDAVVALEGVRDTDVRSRTELSVVVDDGPRAIPRIGELLDDRQVAVESIAERVVGYDEAFVELVSEPTP